MRSSNGTRAESDGYVADAADLVVKGAGRHDTWYGTGRGARRCDCEPVHGIVGRSEADHIQSVGCNPGHIHRLSRQQVREGLRVVSRCHPVGQKCDAGARQVLQCFGDAGKYVRPGAVAPHLGDHALLAR